MSITDAIVADIFAQAKTAFAGALITIRHARSGRVATGIQIGEDGERSMEWDGVRDDTEGRARVLMSDFGAEGVLEGDAIQIKAGDDWVDRRVRELNKDQTSTTAVMVYGDDDA